MIVVDTTILVYAVGADHPLADPCRDLVAEIGSGRIRATTTVEVLQEFAHVRARRGSRSDATHLTRSLATLLHPLIEVGEVDLHAGLDLFERLGNVGAFDAVLVAAAEHAGATAIATADHAFTDATNLDVLSPADPDFLSRAHDLG